MRNAESYGEMMRINFPSVLVRNTAGRLSSQIQDLPTQMPEKKGLQTLAEVSRKPCTGHASILSNLCFEVCEFPAKTNSKLAQHIGFPTKSSLFLV